MRYSAKTLAMHFALALLAGARLHAQSGIALVGAGSNLPNPLYSSWIETYNQRNPSIQLRYMAMGTKEGINQITHGIGDFAAGEVPLSDDQLHAAKLRLVHIPTVLVGVVPIYNIPGVARELKFSGELLAEIFTGRIKSWNDPRIAKINPGVALPNIAIKIVHRTDGKGTNYILTDYLSKVSSEFYSEVGRTPSPKWPLGTIAAQRSEDMVNSVKAVSGAIGYVELDYALKSGVAFGSVQNSAHKFVKASPESIAAALKGQDIPADFRVSLTNPSATDAYPISSFTWLYVPVTGKPERVKAMKDFLNWAIGAGQLHAQRQGYTRLPDSLIARVQARLELIH